MYHKEPKPLRSMLTNSIVGFTSFVIILFALYLYTFQFKGKLNSIEENTIEKGKIVALLSKEYLETDYELLYNKLAELRFIKNINNIQIYTTNNSGQEIFEFTVYNKEQYRIVEDLSADKIPGLLSPKYSLNHVELVTPILNEQTIVGYVYLNLDTKSYQKLLKQSGLYFVLISLIIIGLAMFISTRIKNTLFNEIQSLASQLHEVTKTKNYNDKCPGSTIRELNVLTDNINFLLSRVSNQINSHVKETEQIRENNTLLEEKVTARTDALKESNQELLSAIGKLHEYKDQLVESEKMASLGDMVAGVAHEVNTPIGLGVTASTLLEDRLNEIKTAYDDKTLKSSQLRKFLEDGQENISIIYRNLDRAAKLISSFKKVAVDQSSEEERVVVFSELLNEVVLTLAPQLKNLPFEITLDCPENLSVITKPGPINQILINLIMNSITHGFEGRDEGQINIEVIQMGQQIGISYRDNGRGIDNKIKAKIFAPFTTTKRGKGGSGLGLHLVFNLVTQALEGNIQLDEQETVGVHFDISFPVKNINKIEES